MKKAIFVMVAILLCPVLASAVGPSLGVGVFGGLEFPLIQEDQGKGSTFGFKAIVKPIALFTFEGHITFVKYGDPELDLAGVTNDLEGSKITGYGVDAILGSVMGAPGIKPYFFAGAGFYKTDRDQTTSFADSDSQLGYSGGLGLGIGLTPIFALDARGRFTIIPDDGDGSKKSVSVVVGINYFFGGK